jgi:uncharacterized membrane protein YgdD (TMEM256/DUF423 family)
MLVWSAERENILVLVMVATEGVFTVKPMGGSVLLLGFLVLLLAVLAEATAGLAAFCCF